MNKKGKITKIISVIASIVFIIYALSWISPEVRYYVIRLISAVISWFRSLPEQIDDFLQNVQSNVYGCEAKASELIPDQITLKDIGDNTWVIRNDKFKWEDGVETNIFRPTCIEIKRGLKEGEDVNYFYMADCHFTDEEYLTYKKQIISSDGIVLGDREFKLKLILKPIEGTQESIEIVSELVKNHPIVIGTYQIQDFEVIDHKFISCNWIEEQK